MKESELNRYISNIIQKSISGQEVEKNKIEFKSKWFNLKDINQESKFLKILTGIANTIGEHGFIVFGYDESNKEFHKTDFKDTGLKDFSDLHGLLSKKLSDLINLELYTVDINEENKVEVLYIPHCPFKPILISVLKIIDKKGNEKIEKQKIFVRKVTGTFEATKDDLELIYSYRRNIVPEYLIEINLLDMSFKYSTRSHNKFLKLNLNIENLGRRVISIKNFKVVLDNGDIIEPTKIWNIELNKFNDPGNLSQSINPNSSKDFSLDFNKYLIEDESEVNKEEFIDSISAVLTNGKELKQRYN